MRLLTILAVMLGCPAAFADDAKKPMVREIPLKEMKVTPLAGGKPTEPTAIKSREELAKSPVVGTAAEELTKLIDFDKDKLLVFSWRGSGQDNVTLSIGAEGKDSIVYGEFIRGTTKDLRTHVRLFAVPKDLKVVVDSGK